MATMSLLRSATLLTRVAGPRWAVPVPQVTGPAPLRPMRAFGSTATVEKNRPSAKQKKRARGEPDLEAFERDAAGDTKVMDPHDSSKNSGRVGNDKRKGERYDQDETWERFKAVIQEAESALGQLASRLGSPDPKVLEKLPAQLHHNRDDTTHKIKELATVGAEGDGYVIHCFDKNYVKAIEKAIYDSKLGLIPNLQPGDDEGVIRVPLPKPTEETRKEMLKESASVAEHYRRKARDVRKVAQKLVKMDTNKGVVGKREGESEAEEVDEEVKAATQAINKMQADLQEKLRKMEEDDM